MRKQTKVSVLFLFLILVLSCQKPLIKKIIPQPEKPIITALQSYTRDGYQDFNIHDSLKIIDSEDLHGLASPSFLKHSNELIFTTLNGHLYFVSLDDFSNSRDLSISAGIAAAPSLNGNTLYIAANKGEEGLFAYNVLTGKMRWELPGQLSNSSPIVTQNYVIHTSIDGYISAYHLNDGERAWQVDYKDPILNNLALIGENMIVASQNGKVSNYNPQSGYLNWTLNISEAVYASPVVNKNHIFIATYSGSIIQIETKAGIITHRFSGKSPIFKTPALDNATLYFLMANGKMIALDKSNLKQNWQTQLDGPASTPPLVTKEEILVGTESKIFYRLDKITGEILQSIKLPGRPGSQVAFYKDKIYLSYEPDFLVLFSTKAENND
jgi:outer membrane protein assembly factor BamB